MEKGNGIYKASVLVFMASACSMVLELVAGRILAPYIGVSLYTWTSIIGVVLAGIAIGNYLGGKIGDRWGSPFVLTCIFIAGGVASLAILPVTSLMNTKPLPYEFHLMTKSTLYTLMLFFLPTCVLGMVTPVVIKLNLGTLQKTGSTVGTIYAISTFGAILGTFATGFILISLFGTRSIIWGIAGILLILGIFASASWKRLTKWTLILFMIAVYSGFFTLRDSYAAPVLMESNYYSINIQDTTVQGRNVKYISLDRLIHSYVDLEDPTFHGYDYEKTFARLSAYIGSANPGMNVLFIGGGGYAFSRYMEVTYPEAVLEVVEIDPAVTGVAYDHLGLSRNTRIKTLNSDARIFLMQRTSGAPYSLVVGDAFNDMSVPYHLTTYEFNEHIKRNITADGLYMINVIDDLQEGRFVSSLLHTLRGSFEYVYLYLTNTVQGSSGPGTYVIVASNRTIDMERLAGIEVLAGEQPDGRFVRLEEVPAIVPMREPVFLQDDYVPVDNMIALLFTH